MIIAVVSLDISPPEDAALFRCGAYYLLHLFPEVSPPTAPRFLRSRLIPDTLKPLAVSIDTLHPYERNPRNGDLEAIKESLEANAQYRPIVVNARDNRILAGNHTYAAAMELGWQEIAATFVDVDDEQAARIVLVDNRTNDLAWNDDALIAEILNELPSLEGTGYDDEALDDLLSKINVPFPEDWDASLGNLPDGGKGEFQQMTFTLHDSQAEQVNKAMDLAKQQGEFTGLNENSNGNALARICETYVTMMAHG